MLIVQRLVVLKLKAIHADKLLARTFDTSYVIHASIHYAKGGGGGETATAPPLATSLNPQVGYEIEINRKRSHCQPRLGAIVS